jgi:HK97 family phage portal protein
VGRLIFLMTGGKVVQRSEAKYEAMTREGYEANAIVYRCHRLIADALKSVPIQIFDGDTDVTDTHELAAVLAEPNPQQIWEELLDSIVGHLNFAGEEFLEGVTVRGGTSLKEIYSQRPDRMEIEPAEDGGVGAYIFDSAGGRKSFPLPKRGVFAPILHLRHWNPRNHWRGFAPMAAGSAAGDEHNAAVAYAKALYENSARPSGALVFAPKEGPQTLTQDQKDELRLSLDENHTGAENAGRPLLLEGGLTWEPMGLSPKEMESGEGRNAAAREIAFALGVPPLLLGLPGDNTFANYYEAKLAFWKETAWPLAIFIAKKITAWVRPIYGPNIKVCFDYEASGLAEAEMRDRWDRITKADFLTIDEKRGELGWDEYEEPADDKPGGHILVSGAMSTLEDVIAGEMDPAEAGAAAYGKTKDGPPAEPPPESK